MNITKQAYVGLIRIPAQLVFSMVFFSACSARQSPTTWPVECVGRLTVSLPGQVDVGAMTFEQFLQNSGERSYQFDDGEPAFYSYFQYGGNIAITQPLTAAQSTELIAGQRARFLGVTRAVASGKMKSADFKRFQLKKIDTAEPAYGWILSNESEVSIIAYLPIPGHATSWMVTGTGEQGKQIQKDFLTMRKGARHRPIFTVPGEKGVCLPYMFIQDGGDDSAGRLVAATYRLRDHPDITIMLKDATATGVPSHSNAEHYSAINQSNFFWTQDYQQAKSVESLLSGSYNKVKLAGQSAVETKFRIRREDDTEDFGYLVIARGDPAAAFDKPDVMIYVIRDAGNARKKGKVPLSKSAFFAMAESIAASVKHRDGK